MTLYLIGLGLCDKNDITLKGLEALKTCDEIYLEHYTSILGVKASELSELYGKEVKIATRDLVEKEAEEKLIRPSKEKNVALLVVGDVFGATTHTDLLLRAKELNVDVEIIYNASIINAVGVVGLELYKYGKTTSIVFPDDNWLPETPYDVIKQNKENGLHTLCLLDIKVAEPTKKNLLVGRNTPQDPRFMTVEEGLGVLLRIEQKREEKIISEDTLAIGIVRLGCSDQLIIAGTIKKLLTIDFGKPLHSLIIPGKLHHVEEDAIKLL